MKSIECLIWESVLNNELYIPSAERELIFHYSTNSSLIFPAKLQPKVREIEMPGDGEFNIYKYLSHDLNEIINSMMETEPERLDQKRELDMELENIDDISFTRSYKQDFINGQIQRTNKELPHKLINLPQGLLEEQVHINHVMNSIIECEFQVKPEDFWKSVFLNPSTHVKVLAFDGWDGNSKELLVQGIDDIYLLSLQYS